MIDNCEVLEVTADFWQDFEDFNEESISSDCTRKLEVQSCLDKIRKQQRR